ncbi:MAG: formate dehydrogenase accessory protein FdhE [Desulfobacterales bacterium]|nr:formate dehydrogenase accessory protein FdhE [Desulfobacterales bacterium]
MAGNIFFTSDQIKKAVAVIQKQRPAYAELLDFYGQIFAAQEDSKSLVKTDPVQIPEHILSVKISEHLPLINISDFVTDQEAADLLLKKICDIAQEANKDMAVSAKALIHAVDTEKIDTKLLFSNLLGGNDSFFEDISKEFEIRKNILAFITYTSIFPSLSLCAEQVSAYLKKDEKWEKGYCPVCGTLPGLSMLRDEGRFLFCGFCWQEWAVQRIYCPFCNNSDSNTLHYFYTEQEKDYRVDVCDKCKKYIKTVDARETERIIYPPLEQVSTLHLDIMAKEKGLESGVCLFLQ